MLEPQAPAWSLGGLAGVRPEVVGALVLPETRWQLLAMEEVAHDPVRHGPVITVQTVMMRAQRRFSREL